MISAKPRVSAVLDMPAAAPRPDSIVWRKSMVQLEGGIAAKRVVLELLRCASRNRAAAERPR